MTQYFCLALDAEQLDIREIFYLAHCEDLKAFPNTKGAGHEAA
jgi:hypothetical protein